MNPMSSNTATETAAVEAVTSTPSNTSPPGAAGHALWIASLALGLLAVVWVGAGFVGNNPLALVMTLAIGGVYLTGAVEVHRFRQRTSALAQALAQVPQPLATLGDWLPRVPAALRHAVRARIEGERVALPALALTPYLIGLLVMLGMLGTFLGMVVTFKGAVFALEGSTDLQAIRSALAAPIRGLGLSFGTSVAGVATSAMLGLMAALARRERVAVARALDAKITTDFRPFSQAQQRVDSFRALQQQAEALPQVAHGLQALMEQMEKRGQQLDEQLLARQAQFHSEAAAAYTGLARSVEQSLRESLAAGASAAGESLRPIVTTAMAGMAAESTRLHEQVGAAVQSQLDGLSTRFAATADQVAGHWRSALQQQADTSERLVGGLERSLGSFTSSFEERAAALLTGVQEHANKTQAAQGEAATAQQAAWATSLQSVAADLQAHWQRVGEQTLAHQQTVCHTLEHTAQAITEGASQQAGRSMEGVARLLEKSEALVQARAESEAQWAQQQGQRMDQIASLWRSELTAMRDAEAARAQAVVDRLASLQAEVAQHLNTLRTDESTRSQAAADRATEWQAAFTTQLEALRNDEATRSRAAVDRLGELQTAVNSQVSTHLATLGTALEAPMARLIETASEAPKAAAEVIAQLRQEMSRLTERDNLALQERSELVAHISTLLQNVQQTTGEQRAAIETLVASATEVLNRTGEQFAQTMGAQAGRAEEQATHMASSATELAALGEAFQQGVQLFSSSNEKLMEGLQRVEAAMGQSMARSDEQLAYYVAQAREVIDLSISAQQGIVEDLRHLRSQPATLAEGTA